ncbi:MAG: DUF5916 domain-containing protein [Ferruginibacter sp.]
MTLAKLSTLFICLLLNHCLFGQNAPIPQKNLIAKRTQAAIKIDGLLDEAAWKDAPVADKFTMLRPAPFVAETEDNRTEVFFLYDDKGIYIGGYFHEKYKDSIAYELSGRDGFGNNDFAGIIFDTYNDKLNGFEYFVTPLGEQWDSKFSPVINGNSEDFSWNAVWESAAKIHNDGWSFEMMIPYSAIRFGKKNVQDWGLNIVRKRERSGQQLFWRSIDPNVNGFLTQEGMLTGLSNIKPPLRLQFSPYFSSYINHDGFTKKTSTPVNGGLDLKYGINQAFTLDMTLIPDFGQVQTDRRVLNLSPFEVRFQENRPFFTEGVELFNKGNLFYSRRIGDQPVNFYNAYASADSTEYVKENPENSKLINATKISGRTQKGLGIAMLNAITSPQHAIIEKTDGSGQRKFETSPLTNYNVFVLDQTLKNNSSVSFANTNVLRNGPGRDANVSSVIFDINNKKNSWGTGGSFSMSNVTEAGKTNRGYAYSFYTGRTKGQLNYNIWQEVYDAKYDKTDLGYFTNNNTMDQGIWVGYSWIKPKYFYNQARINVNLNYSRLMSPLDNLRRKEMMYQRAGLNINGNAQLKNLWWMGFNFNLNAPYNDFYEPREYGRVFRNKSTSGLNLFVESNTAKKFSFNASAFGGLGSIFKRKVYELSFGPKYRFSSKFSIDYLIDVFKGHNTAGFAGNEFGNIYFSKRDLTTVENSFFIKYSFTNKMQVTLRTRHYWSHVKPLEYFELDLPGNLQKPSKEFTGDATQNYNFFSADMVYNWQFAQGSFLTIAWKDIAEDFNRMKETKYGSNLDHTLKTPQFNSLSVRLIYFIDYLNLKNKIRK